MTEEELRAAVPRAPAAASTKRSPRTRAPLVARDRGRTSSAPCRGSAGGSTRSAEWTSSAPRSGSRRRARSRASRRSSAIDAGSRRHARIDADARHGGRRAARPHLGDARGGVRRSDRERVADPAVHRSATRRSSSSPHAATSHGATRCASTCTRPNTRTRAIAAPSRRCSRASGSDDPALHALAEIVHDIDCKDDKYDRPEAAGVESILRGLVSAHAADADRVAQGSAIFDALFAQLGGATR